MNKYIYLLKVNFKQNFKIFISFNIISLIAFIFTFMACKFKIDYTIVNQISNSNLLVTDINWYLNMFLFFVNILYIIYIFTLIYLRFSDYWGTLYTTMQLPIKRYYHLFSIISEGIIFIFIQYILFYLLLKINYIYLLSTLSKIENSYLYTMYDFFKNRGSLFAFGSIYPLWSMSIKNIFYRLLISWPAITSYCVLAYMLIHRYGIKLVCTISITLLLLIIFTSNVSFISNIVDSTISALFEVFFYKVSLKNSLNSALVLLSLIFVNTYIIKKKLDF